jgi:tetratricopeptide (TPR) repeat protein
MVLALAACHHATPGPSPATRAAVSHAEDLERTRQHDQARAAYERAIATAPDRASQVYARLELASQLVFWGEIAAAVGQLEAVVGLDPGQARAWHDLGILRHELGDDPGARAALEHAVTLAPDDPRPRIALAALLWETGDLAAARAQYQALLELDLPDAVRAKVEWAIRQLGDAPRP